MGWETLQDNAGAGMQPWWRDALLIDGMFTGVDETQLSKGQSWVGQL